MSDKEFESELKKLNTPYSEKSPVVNHRTRKFLTNLSFIVADAWRLSDAAEYCREIVNGDSPDPLPDLGRLIHPGEDANRNCICVYMRKLGGQMVRYGEGNCPRHAVVIRASHLRRATGERTLLSVRWDNGRPARCLPLWENGRPARCSRTPKLGKQGQASFANFAPRATEISFHLSPYFITPLYQEGRSLPSPQGSSPSAFSGRTSLTTPPARQSAAALCDTTYTIYLYKRDRPC